MKTKYLTTVLLLTFLFNFYSCQTIVDLKNRKGENNPNTYYKDIDSGLNAFEGTWVYDNGTEQIKLILVKKNKAVRGNWFEDILIGGFQYVHNNSEMINTLSQLNIDLPDPIDYNIWGNYFQNNHTPFDEFTTDNNRLIAHIDESDCISNVDIRTLILNGQPAIQIYKRRSIESITACTPVIPGGFYYLIKQ